MKHVRCISQHSSLYGKTALQREDGRVQLDGPKDDATRQVNPLCFGWHDLDVEWEEPSAALGKEENK